MIVAFIGNDGGGKTTVIHRLKERWQAEGRGVILVPGFQHLFIDRLKTFYSFVSRKEFQTLHREYASFQSRKSVLFFIWPYLVFLDCCFLWLKYRFRKEIVIFDRYPFDYAVSFEELGVSTYLLRWLFIHFPKPAFAVLLDAAPDVAFGRKRHDHFGNLSYYCRQRARYFALASRIRIPIVNTDQRTVEETIEEVLKHGLNQTIPVRAFDSSILREEVTDCE